MNGKIPPNIEIEFVNKVRLLLIRLAQTETDENGLRNAVMESERQWLEGVLGIHRKELGIQNPADVEDALVACGILERKPPALRVVRQSSQQAGCEGESVSQTLAPTNDGCELCGSVLGGRFRQDG